METLKVSNDYVFKRIFGHKNNREILKDLLECCTTYNYQNSEKNVK